jgi:hypothetical protein
MSQVSIAQRIVSSSLINGTEGVAGNANVVMRVTGSPAYTVIAFSYLLIIFYALTLAPICWVYAAEVWSLETRAVGMSIAAIGNWLCKYNPTHNSYHLQHLY